MHQTSVSCDGSPSSGNRWDDTYPTLGWQVNRGDENVAEAGEYPTISDLQRPGIRSRKIRPRRLLTSISARSASATDSTYLLRAPDLAVLIVCLQAEPECSWRRTSLPAFQLRPFCEGLSRWLRVRRLATAAHPRH